MVTVRDFKKQRHYFVNTGPSSQSYGFSSSHESWIIKRKLDVKELMLLQLWCWRRLLRIPWTARRPNQSFLKEISPEYSSEGLMLKLNLQYFGHLIRRADSLEKTLMRRPDSLEKTLMLGKIEGGRRRGRQMAGWHHQLDGHEFE